MGPIRLSRGERAALKKLVMHDGACEQRLIKRRHADGLIERGLMFTTPQRYHLTVRGQVEILRQRFSGLRARADAAVQKDEDAFLFIQTRAY